MRLALTSSMSSCFQREYVRPYVAHVPTNALTIDQVIRWLRFEYAKIDPVMAAQLSAPGLYRRLTRYLTRANAEKFTAVWAVLVREGILC